MPAGEAGPGVPNNDLSLPSMEADSSHFMSSPVLRIRLFGRFEVALGDAPIGPLRSRTVQWLLALLVLRHDRDVERAWLAGMLWPESSNEQALGNLRQSLANLRGVLGDEARRLTAPTTRTLRLDLEG